MVYALNPFVPIRLCPWLVSAGTSALGGFLGGQSFTNSHQRRGDEGFREYSPVGWDRNALFDAALSDDLDDFKYRLPTGRWSLWSW